jgi:hypothetical protein
LGYGKCGVRYWHGDFLDGGEFVGNDDVLAGYVADVGRKLGDKIQMVKLTW